MGRMERVDSLYFGEIRAVPERRVEKVMTPLLVALHPKHHSRHLSYSL